MTVVDLVEPQVGDCSQAEAELLGGRVMAAAGDVARQEAAFLDLVGEFDAVGAFRWWHGLRSTANWLSWACSIAPGTAREHVRVARAMRRMPKTQAAFVSGELTYSKVRELTRLIDRPGSTDDQHQDDHDLPSPAVDEDELINLARACTASQLARSVAGYRAAAGTSRLRRARQRVAWVTRDDGCLQLTAVLPPEVGAAIVAAIQAAADASRVPEPQPGESGPDDAQPGQHPDQIAEEAWHRTRVEALYEVANHYLASRPEDRSGEDRTMVVLEVNADALDSLTPDASDSVPAGTLLPSCRVRDGGASIEPSAARTALCDSPVLGVIIDRAGQPLAVGREQRLVTRAQRRALMVRDGCCQYPGCSRSRLLNAHHRVSWLAGGATDLDNLILLCQWHHSRVHEDRISIDTCSEPGCGIRWRFSRPDDTAITPIVAGLGARSPWRPGRGEARRINDDQVAAYDEWQAALREQSADLHTRYAHIGHTSHPDARTVFPVGGGEGFQLADCVTALFNITTPKTRVAA